jgi:hypothetical protein
MKERVLPPNKLTILDFWHYVDACSSMLPILIVNNPTCIIYIALANASVRAVLCQFGAYYFSHGFIFG